MSVSSTSPLADQLAAKPESKLASRQTSKPGSGSQPESPSRSPSRSQSESEFESAHPLLAVNNLHIQFATQDGSVHAVNDISFALAAGGTLGIVGESGSGKSQTVLAIMGLLASNASTQGSIRFQSSQLGSCQLDTLKQGQLNHIRGNEISMIFQDPMTSLNPYLKISTQMAEVLQVHKGLSRAAALHESIRMLDAVHIPDAANRIKAYPHEFSGGMRQRVMIAMALLCQPQLLIADEPTTALDVTVQKEILQLLKQLQNDLGMAMVFITHDLGVVRETCDDMLVMYGGQVMEAGSVQRLFSHSKHPYTLGLMASLPKVDHPPGDPLQVISGSPPDMLHPPPGCPFAPRCEHAVAVCEQQRPHLESMPIPAPEAAASESGMEAKHIKACHVSEWSA